MKKKLTFGDLSEFFPILTNLEQMQFWGGGSGTSENPFTVYEALRMIEEGVFNGGYVEEDNGELSFWLPETSIYCNSSGYENDYGYAYYSDNSYDYDNPWGAYYYDPNYNPWINDNLYGLIDFTGDIGTISDAIESYAGKTQIGSNNKLYFETKTGRVFLGNQYVGTTSLEGLAKSLNKYLGPAGVTITAYNIMSAYQEGGIDSLIYSAGKEAGGWAGAIAGGKVGAAIGTAFCPGAGTLIGGIIGAIGGSWGGSYIVEIFY